MKGAMVVLLAAALCFLLASVALAADTNTTSHSVTVTVNAISVISVTGTPTLTVSTATAGSDPDSVETSSSSLAWTTNAKIGATKKITGALDSNCPDGLTLKVYVDATGSNGTSAGYGGLSTTAVDLVTGIYKDKLSGRTLTYRAIATVNCDPATVSRTVTYTIADTL